MADINKIAIPPLFIAGYLKQQLIDFGIVPNNPDWTPFIPATMPVDISSYYDQLTQLSGEPSPVVVQYDKLMRFRTTPFYRHQREQMLLTIRCSSFDKKESATRIISEALDREDASAVDVNLWSASNTIFSDPPTNSIAIPKNVYFHNFKVYQVDESRDIVELSAVKTDYWDKVIVQYDYHTTDSNYN